MKAAGPARRLILPKTLVLASVIAGTLLALVSLTVVQFSDGQLDYGVKLPAPSTPTQTPAIQCGGIAELAPQVYGWPLPYMQEINAADVQSSCFSNTSTFLDPLNLALDIAFWSLLAGAAAFGWRKLGWWPFGKKRGWATWTNG